MGDGAMRPWVVLLKVRIPLDQQIHPAEILPRGVVNVDADDAHRAKKAPTTVVGVVE